MTGDEHYILLILYKRVFFLLLPPGIVSIRPTYAAITPAAATGAAHAVLLRNQNKIYNILSNGNENSKMKSHFEETLK